MHSVLAIHIIQEAMFFVDQSVQNETTKHEDNDVGARYGCVCRA